MRIERFLDALATAAIKEVHDVDQPALLRRAGDPKHGDYQINAAMALGKKLGKPPREIAEPVAAKLAEHDAIASAEVAGPGFVNLRLDDGWLAARLGEDLADAERAGVPAVDAPETVIVDFSSPNIAKQMHVGHLRSTIIGASLVRILRLIGHRVIGDNHLGDWGTQYGLLIVGMREWGDEEALLKAPIVELERVYKLASERAKEDDAFAEQARAELKKLQDGDPENTELWKRFIAATRISLERVYDKLGVSFDEWLGESAYHEMLPGVVDRLLDSGIAVEDDGAICVFFEGREDVPKALKKSKSPFIVRKRDGAFNYATTDVATVLYRKEHFDADRAIYVVDSRQGQHFQQLFAVMKLLGVEMTLEHVGFGMVLGTDGKAMRTRDASGKVITLEALLDEAVARAEQKIREAAEENRLKVPEHDIPQVSRAVGIGAVKYADLSNNRTSNYQFDFDKMISFSGNAGPYMQYAYARTRSIFRKGEIDPSTLGGPVSLGAPEEAALARELIGFADAVHAAADGYLPHLISDHLYAIARAFSAFYTECPVLDSEGATRDSRLALTALTSRQLRIGLELLGIEPVERM